MSYTSSDQSSFENCQQTTSYIKNGIFPCKSCKTLIPSQSLNAHMALKHSIKADDSDQTEDHNVKQKSSLDTVVAPLRRRPFREIPLISIENRNETTTESVASRIRRSGEMKKAEKNDTNVDTNKESGSEGGQKTQEIGKVVSKFQDASCIETNDNYQSEFPDDTCQSEYYGVKSTELHDSRLSRKKNSRKTKKVPNENTPASAWAKKPEREERTSHRSIDMNANRKVNRSVSETRPIEGHRMTKPPHHDHSQHQRPKRSIPSVYDIFNFDKSIEGNHDLYAEVRKFEDDIPGYDTATQQRQRPAPFIPEHCVQCTVCKNIMHTDHIKGHIQRKHGIENEGLIDDGYHKCQICSNLMPKEFIQSHIERMHGNDKQTKDNFVHCNLCPSFMHIGMYWSIFVYFINNMMLLTSN